MAKLVVEEVTLNMKTGKTSGSYFTYEMSERTAMNLIDDFNNSETSPANSDFSDAKERSKTKWFNYTLIDDDGKTILRGMNI